MKKTENALVALVPEVKAGRLLTEEFQSFTHMA